MAQAADAPGLWFSESVGASGWPAGVLSTTAAEVRTPLFRSDSIVFQDTQAGAGAQVLVSPAFVLVGPRVTLAPIDVFDVTLRATWGWYFDGGLGFLPYQGVTGTLDLQRDARKDEGFASTALTLGADPTLKLKLWRIIGLDAWSFSNFRVTPVPGLDAPYVYEPLTDVVIAWNDTLVEQQAVLLFEGIDGVDRPLLLVGATEKNRWTLVSKDRSMLVGAIAVARPGTKPVVPTIAAMVLWYVDDFDREGPIPTLQGQVSWEIDRPFR